MDPPVDVTRCQAPVQGPSGIVNECFSSTEKLACQRLFHFRNKKSRQTKIMCLDTCYLCPTSLTERHREPKNQAATKDLTHDTQEEQQKRM